MSLLLKNSNPLHVRLILLASFLRKPSVNNSLACHPINKYGTEEQKQKFLKPLASGDKLGGFGLTEPGAGTDVSLLQTTAVKKDGGYEINGQKIFITNGSKANTYVIFAQNNKELKHRGISAFILNEETDGFSTGTVESKLGIHGSIQCELNFDDMFLPEDQRLSAEGDGFKIAMNALDGGRIAFVLLEWVRRGRRIAAKTEGLVHLIGFALIIVFFLAVTFQDIVRIVSGESLIP